MKQSIFAFVAAFLLATGVASASSVGQVAPQVARPLPSPVAIGSAVEFGDDLYFGMRNSAKVKKLQEFLGAQGYYAGPVTGNFFGLTRESVKKFQQENAVNPTGYFGPKSRGVANAVVKSDIRELCYGEEDSCNGVNLPLPGLVIATESDLQARVGAHFAATFTVSGGTGNYRITPSGVAPAGLSWTRTYCPEGQLCAQMESPDSVTLYGTPTVSGMYRVTIIAKEIIPPCESYGDLCAQIRIARPRYGKAAFTLFIAGGSTRGAPVISQVSGPQKLAVAEEGLWTILARDPSGGRLTYSVEWGDETMVLDAAGAANARALPPAQFFQTGTFSHTYAKQGVYKPTFIVANEFGQRASASLTVTVGAGMPEEALSIWTRSPLQGSVGSAFDAVFGVSGGTEPYRWAIAEGSLPPGLALKTPLDPSTPRPLICPVTPGSDGCARMSYATIVGTPTQSGSFGFVLQVTDGTGNTGLRKTVITIENGKTFSVTSPEAGAQWHKGQSYEIRWSDGLKDGRNVSITMQPYAECQLESGFTVCPMIAIAPYVIAESVPNSGVFTWKVPADMSTRFTGKQQITVATADGSRRATSNVFVVLDPKADPVTVTSPAAGTVWTAGKPYMITWKPSDGGTVTIDLIAGHPTCLTADPPCMVPLVYVAPYPIATGIKNSGQFEWTIPSGLGTPYYTNPKIRVTLDGTDKAGYSGAFTLRQQ